MSENKTPKIIKSTTFDYGNPLRTSTFDSETTQIGESSITVRPVSTSDYKRLKPIAKAYNLPVPDVKLKVIKLKSVKTAKHRIGPNPSSVSAKSKISDSKKTLIIKVPGSVEDQESSSFNDIMSDNNANNNTTIHTDNTSRNDREASVTDLFASMIKPQKTLVDNMKLDKSISEQNQEEKERVKYEKKSTYRQRKHELLNLTSDQLVDETTGLETKQTPSSPRKRKVKKAKNLKKAISQQSLITSDQTTNGLETSLIIDETSFTTNNNNNNRYKANSLEPLITLSSMSFNSKSARYSYEVDEKTAKENEKVSLFAQEKQLSFRSTKEDNLNNDKNDKYNAQDDEDIKKNEIKEDKKSRKEKKSKKKKSKKTDETEAQSETTTILDQQEQSEKKENNLVESTEKMNDLPKQEEEEEKESKKEDITNRDLPSTRIEDKKADESKSDHSDDKLKEENLIDIEDNNNNNMIEQKVNENNDQNEKPGDEEDDAFEDDSSEDDTENEEDLNKTIDKTEEQQQQAKDDSKKSSKKNSKRKRKPKLSRSDSKVSYKSKKDYIKENKKSLKKNKLNRIHDINQVVVPSSTSALGKATVAATTTVEEINETNDTKKSSLNDLKKKKSFSSNFETLSSKKNDSNELITQSDNITNDDSQKLVDNNSDTKTITSQVPSPPPPSALNINKDYENLNENYNEFNNKDKDKIVRFKIADDKLGRSTKKKPFQCTKNQLCLIITGSIILFLVVLLIVILAVALKNRSGLAQLAPLFNMSNSTTSTTTPTTTTTTTITSTTTTTTALTCISTTTPSQTQLVTNSYSCPYNTPYISKFLSLAESYSYGYPIYQQIVCMGSIVSLVCPANQYIHIYSAYFGIQSSTMTQCITVSSTTPTNCFNKAVFNTINSTCEYNNNCSIVVTVSQLGDPCFGNSKQLMIQYQCLDYNTITTLNQCPVNKNTSTACLDLNDTSIITKQWCEPSLMQLQCAPSTVIDIVCAYYGIDSNYQCPSGYYTGAPTSCYSKSSQQLLMSKCNGKTTCSVLGNPNYQVSGFSDPCTGFSKIFYVQYRCITQTTTITTTTTTVNSSTITTTPSLPYCQNFVTPSGTCSSVSASPYVPTFLSPNKTSFTYPVMQQIVCSGASVNLVCPTNSVIHIYAAYFGIQSTTSVSSCFLTTSEQPAMCYYSKSFSYINSTCEYQQSCLISANTLTLGDACPNYVQKQLLIQYQCVDSYALNTTINQCNTVNATVPLICPIINVTNMTVFNSVYTFMNLTNSTSVSNSTKLNVTNSISLNNLTNSTNLNTATYMNSTIHQQVWCDGDIMNITCRGSQNITILCAFYGLHPSVSSYCGISSMLPDIPVCYFKNSFTFIDSLCSRNNSCSLSSFSSKLIDPCNGQTKALFIQWKCS